MCVVFILQIGMKDVGEQLPLNLALNSNGVDVADYLIRSCGCGGEIEKIELLCKACYHGKLDVVKVLVMYHKLDPNGKITKG